MLSGLLPHNASTSAIEAFLLDRPTTGAAAERPCSSKFATRRGGSPHEKGMGWAMAASHHYQWQRNDRGTTREKRDYKILHGSMNWWRCKTGIYPLSDMPRSSLIERCQLGRRVLLCAFFQCDVTNHASCGFLLIH